LDGVASFVDSCFMIVGRAEELAQLERLLAELRAERGGTLVLRGEAGIGKTTLLEALGGRCGAEVTMLRAGGVEAESELAFSALSDLLTPIVAGLAALPVPQAAALAAAIAIAPPQPGDRLAVCVATLGLLRAAGRERPVLALVDDVQWLDAPSRECILYAARRAAGPVGFVLAVRDPEEEDAKRRPEYLPEIRLGPLDYENSLQVLAHAIPDLTAQVARALANAAAGNPLALVELPPTLSNEQRHGLAELDPPLAPGRRLHVAFARRIAELSGRARRALLVAATYEGDDLATIGLACARADTSVALLAEAETRGLARLAGDRLVFGHPLIRGAVYRGAPAAERRGAHRALADALQGEQRAWHLAAAAIGPDERAAAELEHAAAAAAARRGFASAAVALERAARLSPDTQAFARRMLAAGQAAGAAGLPARSLALLADAAGAAGNGGLRARIEHLRGLVMAWSGSVAPAAKLLASEAERAATEDPALAADMLADAAAACTATNRYYRAQALAERAAALLGEGGDPPRRGHVLTILGWILVLRGQTRRARSALDEARGLAVGLDPFAPGGQWLNFLLRAHIVTGNFEQALAESLALAERARDAGALGTLGGALVVAADAAFRLGDWETTEAATREAIRVSEEAGQSIWHGYALSIRARLTAACGLEDEARRTALAAVALAKSADVPSGGRYAHAALGFLHLGAGRIGEAMSELETVERLMAGSGLEEPMLVPWAPDLIEAYVRAGRTADARAMVAVLQRQAAAAGTAITGAVLARCHGMLDEDFDAAFAEALTLDDQRPMPFERARTLLSLGRRLHRARRRAEARDSLRQALAGFERIGAVSWAAQAQSELRAAGARRRAAHDDSMTAQELLVATAVSRGTSNREIATELFLAPKTVEFHLRQIYRKLGVGSRAQLVATLARTPAAEPPEPRTPTDGPTRDGPIPPAPAPARPGRSGASGSPARMGPAPPDEASVPAQQGPRGD
jgi:DNA-binding CsgD family transcriptional regulator